MIYNLILFIYGLIFGSFINAFLWRFSTRKSLMGRSICPSCKHQLSWYDNIPIISWFLLSGKCRYCKKSISVQYPIIEFVTALTFLFVGKYSQPGQFILKNYQSFQLIPVKFIIYVVLLSILLAISIILIITATYDYKTKEIPNSFNFSFIGIAVIFLIISGVANNYRFVDFIPYLLSAFFVFFFFYTFVFFSGETWMGGGDAKLALGMGLLLGPQKTFLLVMFSSIIGSLFGFIAIIISRIFQKKNKKLITLRSEVPFGPFLVLGFFIAYLAGMQIVDFYVKVVLNL